MTQWPLIGVITYKRRRFDDRSPGRPVVTAGPQGCDVRLPSRAHRRPDGAVATTRAHRRAARSNRLAAGSRRRARQRALRARRRRGRHGHAPLLSPKGPANTAPADLFMMAGLVVIVVWAGSVGARLRLPYIFPLGIMMVGGLIAAFVNGSVNKGTQAVLQELFLLLWCGAGHAVPVTERALRTIVRAWALSGIAWASFLVVAIMLGQNSLAGVGTLPRVRRCRRRSTRSSRSTTRTWPATTS